jgi:protease-4
MVFPMRRPAVAALLSLASFASLAALASVAMIGCRGRPRSWDLPLDTSPSSDGAFLLEFDLGSGVPERSSGGLFSLPSRDTFDVLVAALHQAQKRKEIKGVFLSFGVAPIGWARAHELGDSLVALKKQFGIKMSCHADAWDNTSYAAAVRACDVISMSPGGEVEMTGPAASIPYARELLEDKLHAQVDILQVGRFKGAAEPLTRDGPSDEYKESIERALGAISKSNHDALEARGVDALIGTGPWAGNEAIDKKLVDVLMDKKAAREAAKKDAGGVPIDVVFGSEDDRGGRPGLLDLLRIFAQHGTEAVNKPNVRLLRLEGEISLGGDGGGLFGGSSGIVSRKLVDQLHRLTNDANVKAVVLRIDSPGGSALGSDLVWLAVKELRDKKPVIVSVGEMAASGGYYIASAANTIYAEPESIVGSVGVVGGKIAFGGTLAMIGVHTASFGDKRAAQLGSLTEPWDDETKARLQGSMETIYRLFLDRVSTGRGQPKEKFENAVEGRVFGGQQAQELGLVDEVGGLSDALAAAKKAGGLSDDAPIVTDEAQGIVDLLDGDDDASAPRIGSDVLAPLPADASSELTALRDWARSFVRVSQGSGVAAMMPAPLILR